MADQTLKHGLANIARKFTGVAKAREHRSYLFDPGAEAVTATFADGTDKVVIFTGFPGCVVTDVKIHITDLDTGGTPAHVFKIVTRTAAGTESDLETGFTTAQAGGTAVLAATKTPLFLNAGSLVLVTTTAADTEAAGTVRAVVTAWYGRINGTTFNAES